MINHDESTHTCMCCNDTTGSDIPGPNWKSYVPPTSPCADGYATYYLMPYQICLKYFPVPVSYSTAKANCHDERANLIKIDSQEKYNIFEDYHVPIANNSVIQVWVQGEKVRGQWQFDDGTPIPEYCPIDMSNKTGDQVHLRAKSSSPFEYSDAENARLCNYSCEYHFLSSFNN
ncbi:uncharacterized protein LOC128171798 [Crassostrea angulata]|uniref:uncharacterized protein LOC128171798 n=1 Tax=Magallana angulata TaxID=2784310 RepID=UPI0022B1D543|nr:uncharacterized protein LOC128171798 [Crassostrea angulata]